MPPPFLRHTQHHAPGKRLSPAPSAVSSWSAVLSQQPALLSTSVCIRDHLAPNLSRFCHFLDKGKRLPWPSELRPWIRVQVSWFLYQLSQILQLRLACLASDTLLTLTVPLYQHIIQPLRYGPEAWFRRWSSRCLKPGAGDGAGISKAMWRPPGLFVFVSSLNTGPPRTCP